jgi:AGCS family alanine or glycine:cation symporter
MGSTPHAHAMAKVGTPHDQGVVAMAGVFIDTFIVLTMTALVVISTLYAGNGPLAAATSANYEALIAAEGISKTNAMQLAVSSIFGASFGSAFVAVCLLFFAFSTIIGWNFFGKINVKYLFKNSKVAVIIYSAIAIVFVFLGSLLSNDLVWELTDFFNYLMVIPNVLALLALSRLVSVEAKSAYARKKEKKTAKKI